MTEIYGPVDVAVKTWLAGTQLADLTLQPGGPAIHLAMPKSNPQPAILINLIAGGPVSRADLPMTRYRLQFDCIAKSRDTASLLARVLVTELDALGFTNPGVVAAGVYLGGADVLSMRWLPDPNSDVPRYIVDALITTVL